MMAEENRKLSLSERTIDPILARVLSVLSRVALASLFSIACYGFLMSYLQTGKLTSLFWIVSEGIVVLLLIFRRASKTISWNPLDWLAAVGGSLTFLLVRPEGMAVAPDSVGFTLQLLGTAFEVYGKASLGRSFGIVAANRGIVIRGPYRYVRHPIYLGYLVTHVGFLLANASAWNVAVYAVAYFFQVSRIFSEERLLSEDSSYGEYMRRVRYRLIPGIF